MRRITYLVGGAIHEICCAVVQHAIGFRFLGRFSALFRLGVQHLGATVRLVLLDGRLFFGDLRLYQSS